MRMVVFAIVMAAALSAGGCELIVGPSLLAANVGTGVEGLTAPKLTRRIHVVDAETNQPVAGATVTATHSLDLMGDWVASGQTDERGEVTLHIANRRLHALSFSITAPGYLWRQGLFTGAHPR